MQPIRAVALVTLVGALLLAAGSGAAADAMTPEKMDSILRAAATHVDRPLPNVWELEFYGTKMACVTSLEHNRMRLLAPVARMDTLGLDHMRRMLEANYHTSLDARYGASEGVVYSLFLHPLSTLSESQLRSAMIQVATLARSFGSAYTSGALKYD